MSLFKTILPVDLKPLVSALPKKAHIVSMTWSPDTSEIECLWDNHQFETGLTVPVTFPLADLKRHALPSGVRDARKPVNIAPPEPKPAPVPTPPAPKPADNAIRTVEQFRAAIDAGKELEYMGITTEWIPVNDVHNFVEGYHYREITASDRGEGERHSIESSESQPKDSAGAENRVDTPDAKA